MAEVHLKPGREKSVLKHHPWIFSGAIASLSGKVEPGETVEVISSDGDWLARGAYSHNSQIAIRIWTWNTNEIIDPSFLYTRLSQSIASRQHLYDSSASNAIRLVHGESDGLPGLVIDQYADVAVMQYLSAGAEYWMGDINRLLPEIADIRYLFERSDADVRKLEGLELRIGPISQNAVPDVVTIREHGLNYRVNLGGGQKTGFYLDQRINRMEVRSFVEDRDVLDCFCYTGGFSLNAWAGKARTILAIDESEEALGLVGYNKQLNAVSEDRLETRQGDVFRALREFRDRHSSFDTIILDPPKFAPTVSQVERAARGYKDINLLAMKLLRKHGTLFTFSCSGGVSMELFEKIIAGAALDSHEDFQIIGYMHQAADHPVAVNFPEGAYLKGLILRRVT